MLYDELLLTTIARSFLNAFNTKNVCLLASHLLETNVGGKHALSNHNSLCLLFIKLADLNPPSLIVRSRYALGFV